LSSENLETNLQFKAFAENNSTQRLLSCFIDKQCCTEKNRNKKRRIQRQVILMRIVVKEKNFLKPCIPPLITARLLIRGGQTAALRTFACGSLSFPKMYIYVFYLLFLLQSVEIL